MKSSDRIGGSKLSLGRESRELDCSSLTQSYTVMVKVKARRRREAEAFEYGRKVVGRFGAWVEEESSDTLCCFAWVTLSYARFWEM